MYDLDEAKVTIEARQDGTSWDSRSRVRRAILSGKLPTLEDAVRARGMVIKAREDSIFTDAWEPIALLLLLIGFFANRNPAFLALGAVLLLIVWVSRWWKDRALHNVSYERTFNRTHVFPHEPIKMTITIRNKKWLPLSWLRIRDELPIHPVEVTNTLLASRDEAEPYTLQNMFAMASYEEKQRVFTLQFTQRGFKELGPVNYQSGDIFTLYTTERTYADMDTLVVYPSIWTLADLGLPAKEPFGPINTRQSLFTDPIKTRGIRDYQPTDRFRDVHWKATARRGRLQTKVYDPSTGMTVVVFLNVATMPKHWQGHFPQLMERAISVAASLAYHGTQQKWGVGLYANGSLPNSDQPIRVQPSRSPDTLMHILEALAAVTEFATASIEKLLIKESPNVPWVATIIVVTAVLTEEIAVELIRLKQAGRHLVVIYLGRETILQSIQGVTIHHITDEVPAFIGAPLFGTEETLADISVETMPA